MHHFARILEMSNARAMSRATSWRRCYSGRENRSPRLCFKTVRASFPAHGSSGIHPLSRASLRTCDLYFHAFASCDAHPYLAESRFIVS